mgnify:CR=1 FL=1
MPELGKTTVICLDRNRDILVEATCVGAYRKLNGEAWFVFEVEGGMIYCRPAASFAKQEKKLPPLSKDPPG